MNAQALAKRVVEELNRRGFEMKQIGNSVFTSKQDYVEGSRYFYIEETYRQNATEENVTAKLKVYENGVAWKVDLCATKYLGEVKIPKNASDKVIANRVNKAMEIYNAR